jgi:hypothetical protein
MKRNQWKAALLALLLFCCGVAVGALAQRYYIVTEVKAKTAEGSRDRYLSEMKSRLKLTPTQLSQLETILDDTKSRVKAVRDSYHPAMVKIHNEHVSRVKSILTPEQIPAYDRLLAEREQKAKAQEERDRQEEQRRAAARAAKPGSLK